MSAALLLTPQFDWRNPEYVGVFATRMQQLAQLRANPHALPAIHAFYREHPAQFINDWGVTHDPRNPERGLPASVPFLLFPRQVQLIEFVMERWRGQEPGLIEKSRDMGASWLIMSLAVTLCLFNRGLTIGVGSRKEQLLDNAGDPNSLFFKARMFHESLPSEFRGVITSAHMRLIFPGTQGAIVGEAGDQIGRGARTSLYFVDEAAYLERPELIEASLSATTNCRIDVSSVNGLNNPFALRRFGGKVPVFTMHWRSDPRRDDAWYAKQVRELAPVVVAQEIDIDYRGSVEGQLIPSAWVQAAIGAAEALGIQPTGQKYAGFDVADEGRDLNAFAGRHGIVLQHLHSWGGKGSDIFKSTVRVMNYCDTYGYYDGFYFDQDGLGAGVRGDADQINRERAAAGKRRFQSKAVPRQWPCVAAGGGNGEATQEQGFLCELQIDGVLGTAHEV